MKDVRRTIESELVDALSSMDIDVYNYVPSNHAEPYIYIGDISTGQIANKQKVEMIGTFTVELWTGTKEWLNSLERPLKWLDEIKVAIQPTRNSRLDLDPYFKMVYLKLDNDTGLQQYSPDKRQFVATIQYEFEFMQLYDDFTEYNVVHSGNNVTHNSINVIQILEN